MLYSFLFWIASLCCFCCFFRGVYIASVFYHKDSLLVTNEDQIPIVEVDDSYSSSLMQDFLWFTKVCKNIQPTATLSSGEVSAEILRSSNVRFVNAQLKHIFSVFSQHISLTSVNIFVGFFQMQPAVSLAS